MAITAGVFLLLLLYWFFIVRPRFFPAGDEFALFVHSAWPFHPSPVSWFRHGFAGYFEPYPDLSTPYSNFLRPLANATYFVQSLFFGRHWALYLLGNYAIVAATVWVVWEIGRRTLALPAALASLIALGAAVSPAVSYQAVLRPSFAFDLLAGLWALLAFRSLIKRRWLAAGSLVLLAVLTKETAYFASPAAALIAFLLLSHRAPAQRALRSALFLLPLLMVALLRQLDFPGGVRGVYVLEVAGVQNPVRRTLLALTHWPYMLPGEQHVFAHSLHNLSALLITGACWALLLLLVVHVVRRSQRPTGTAPTASVASPSFSTEAALLLYLGAALLLPIGLDLAPRFGASVFPLLFPAIGSVAVTMTSRLARWSALALLMLLPVINAVGLLQTLFGAPLQREERLWARSRNMVQLLAEQKAPVVFLVADATESFSSPANVERFSGYRGRIVPVSNLDAADCPKGQLQVASVTPNLFSVRAVTPHGCGISSLGATFHRTPKRVSRFTRSLPVATIDYDAHQGGWIDGQFGTGDLALWLRPRVSAYVVIVPVAEGSPHLLALSPEGVPIGSE